MTKYKYKASMQLFESCAVKMGVQKQKFKTEDWITCNTWIDPKVMSYNAPRFS